MEIQVLEQNSNVIVEAFKVDGGAQSLFDRIAEQARSIVFDINNSKDRDAIKSLARKVSSSKTAFDSHGKELKEQYTAITSKIDADRKLFRDHCDAVSDFAVTVMDSKNANVSKYRLMSSLFEVKLPSVETQNELIGIIEWAYSIPYTIKSKTFAVDVYDSCMEFSYGN